MSSKPNPQLANIPDPNRPFARFFRRWLDKQGYETAAAAAHRLGVSATTAYTWSSGAACIPRSRLAVFAPKFGVTVAALARVALSPEPRRRTPRRRTKAASDLMIQATATAAE